MLESKYRFDLQQKLSEEQASFDIEKKEMTKTIERLRVSLDSLMAKVRFSFVRMFLSLRLHCFKLNTAIESSKNICAAK